MKYDGKCGTCMFYSPCDCGETNCDRNLCDVRYGKVTEDDRCHYPALRRLAHVDQREVGTCILLGGADHWISEAEMETVTLHPKRKRYECALCRSHADMIENVEHQEWCMLGEWIEECRKENGYA